MHGVQQHSHGEKQGRQSIPTSTVRAVDKQTTDAERRRWRRRWAPARGMSLFTARAAAIVLAECCSEHRIWQRLKLWRFQRLAECGSLYVLTSCTACKGGVKLNALVPEWRSSGH